MTANEIVIKLDDLFDQFAIDRLPCVWEGSDDIMVELHGTNYYIQYDPDDSIFYLLEVKTYGGSRHVQATQDWVVVASSENLVDIFKAYLVEEIVQFSDDSVEPEEWVEIEQSSAL